MSDPTHGHSEHLRIWHDGELLTDPSERRISAVDHGLVVGDGVFEALKVTPAGPFTVRRHLERLTRSARMMGLPDPDHDQIRQAIEAVIEGRAYELGRLRITWTGGVGPLGSLPAFGPPTLVVAVDSVAPAPPVTRIVTTPWLRNERGAMTGVKSTSYGENVRALAYAGERDATEGVFVNTAGHLAEGSGTNIYCVFDGEIVTPPLEAGILDGVTRQLVCAWNEVTVRDLTLAEAQTADEVFVSSSLRDVQAVEQWDAVSFSAPGAVTAEVQRVFAERSAADLDP
ncbi:aminotransferase class IV [Propionibacteriaceae bacterium Y1685]|uniref:aminotransferase class IV n=1 Tax=Microlunatus sp. Y1700 TaxID=3418487 RepID=UPI003B79ED0C